MLPRRTVCKARVNITQFVMIISSDRIGCRRKPRYPTRQWPRDGGPWRCAAISTAASRSSAAEEAEWRGTQRADRRLLCANARRRRRQCSFEFVREFARDLWRDSGDECDVSCSIRIGCAHLTDEDSSDSVCEWWLSDLSTTTARCSPVAPMLRQERYHLKQLQSFHGRCQTGIASSPCDDSDRLSTSSKSPGDVVVDKVRS